MAEVTTRHLNRSSKNSKANRIETVKVLAQQRLFFAIFFAIFLRPTEQICPDSAGPFIVSILLALLFSLFQATAKTVARETSTIMRPATRLARAP
jgi:hypothetical protein